MSAGKKIWNALNGLKTLLGGLLHAAWFCYYMFVDTTVTMGHEITGHSIIGILTGIGVTHKVKKLINKQNGQGNIDSTTGRLPD